MADFKPVAEILEGAQSFELRRHELRMPILPRVVAEPRQVIELAMFGVSHIHRQSCQR